MNNKQYQPQGQILGQFAMSVFDLRGTTTWYRDVLGFIPSGGTEDFTGTAAELVMGVPGASTSCWWLVDKQAQFQLEFFRYKRPAVRPRPSEGRACDIGYTMIGVHVADFDAAIERAVKAGTPPLTNPVGPPGERRVCLRDPEHMLIELMEADIRGPELRPRPRPDVTAVTRFVTLSVPDLAASRDFFVDGMGMAIADSVTLHGSEHEALWGLDGARRHTLLIWAGDMLVELVQYLDPIGEPWPHGYRISDQGPLNMAFVYRDKAELNKAFRASIARGARPNHPHIYDFTDWGVMYVNDPQGFSLELLYIREEFDGGLGFLPADPDIGVELSADIAAPLEAVWERIADHESIGDWWSYEGRLIRPGDTCRNGVGAIRELSNMGEFLVEEVVGWDPPFRLDYRVISGAPFDQHFARIKLEPLGERMTRLHYSIRFYMPPGEQADAVTQLVDMRLASAIDGLKLVCERTAQQELTS